jgi:hypothetical protein
VTCWPELTTLRLECDVTFLRLAYFPSATRDHFDALTRHLPAEAPPDRLMFAAGPVAEGWQVVQLWRSSGALDAFNRDAFFPALKAIGQPAFPRPPQVVDFEPAIFSWSGGTAVD